MKKKETNNDRNAGRHKKFIGKTKLKLIPIDSEPTIDRILQPYLNKKKAQ